MMRKISTLFITMLIILSCSERVPNEHRNELKSETTDWKSEVEKTLELFGHRNWIVIADAAYPLQSNQAIKTINIKADQLEAVEFVNRLIEKAKHVDANIFIDKEMEFVPEKDAKGIESYRTGLNKILEGMSVKTMPHEDIILELDSSAKLFDILIIKTDLIIPYTSVFFKLECGYWTTDAERNLRTNIGGE